MNWGQLLHTCIQKGVPFYSYRLPSEEDFTVGVQHSLSVEVVDGFENLTVNRKGFLVAPFLFGQKKPAYFINEDFAFKGSDSPSDALQSYLSSLPLKEGVAHRSPSSITKEEYLHRVRSLIALLHRGEADKVVFARNILFPLEDEAFDWVSVYEQLQVTYPEAFVYCLHLPAYGVWMGASPELLLKKSGLRVDSVALAGTIPMESNEWSAKNQEEQAMVVKYIDDVFRSFGVEQLTVEGPHSVQAGSVCHLKTQFSAVLPSGERALPLLKALHPTPAVCGFPKAKALQLIEQYEDTDRSFYSGFLGPVSDGDFAFFVNLRCVRMALGEAELFVGGGIMGSSDAEDEWNETILKSHTMGRFFYKKN